MRGIFLLISSTKLYSNHLLHSKTASRIKLYCSQAELINQISRILSDHRNPQHDLQSSLTTFTSHISPDLVHQVLKRCKNLGFSAHRFFLWTKQIPGFLHNPQSYNLLVDILASTKQFALLWDFLMETRDSVDSSNALLIINEETFWLLFRAYCNAGCPFDAIRAFGRMLDFGLKPSVNDLHKLLYCLCKRKHVKHAQQFFDEVKSGFMVNAKSYSILINGWGDVGDVGMARKVFDEMVGRGVMIDVLSYNSLLEALCKAEKVDEAYNMFKEMRGSGVQPDARTYAAFIRAYCVMNDIQSAFKVLDRMKRYELVPNVYTYNCVIKKLLKNEMVNEAYQLLEEMKEAGSTPDSWSYNAILEYHCNHTEVNMATKLISRMVEEKCMSDRHSYNMVLKMFIRIGRFDRASQLWESMGENGVYPSVSTYSVMIHGLSKKRGMLEEACKYFEMMIDEGIPPYDTTIQMLRNLLIGRGSSEYVEILADKMRRSTSSSINELALAMTGNKVSRRKAEEIEFEIQESEFESE
ncbi:hypothetical protein ACFE04_031708 [Oxalis oulophora]